MLNDYISTDAMLGKFFEPFIFENLPATDKDASRAYLEQVERCDIYLGIFGTQYGFQDENGISPTEREFAHACKHGKVRLVFINHLNQNERHPKIQQLIQKAEREVIRRNFASPEELKTSVYAALVYYLEEKELIRTVPFDAAICKRATINDIDPDRVRWFIQLASEKRNFPFSSLAAPEEVLMHLNLLKTEGLTNAALLLFGKQTQRFFITAEVRCALFPGYEVEKPITSYQVYKGDVFQQVDAAVDFLLSRVDLYVGDRSKSIAVPTRYELPRAAVKEAVVNAIAHRDYTSNASVQVMLFRNRLEVWNPGQLPYHLPISKLKQPHASYPANPLLAETLYLAGYIERMGTGIPDMVNECLAAGLKEPELQQDEAFKTILWRKEAMTDHVTEHVTDHVTEHVKTLITILVEEKSRPELQELLGIKHRPHFMESYINPALNGGFVEMTLPDKPKSINQKYRLTPKGKVLQQELRKKK